MGKQSLEEFWYQQNKMFPSYRNIRDSKNIHTFRYAFIPGTKLIFHKIIMYTLIVFQ